jgi:hypothetical protein
MAMTLNKSGKVLVALKRPVGYEDVHQDLVAIDALERSNTWPYQIVSDDGDEVVVELERIEAYEDAPAIEIVQEAINKTWSCWRIISN